MVTKSRPEKKRKKLFFLFFFFCLAVKQISITNVFLLSTILFPLSLFFAWLSKFVPMINILLFIDKISSFFILALQPTKKTSLLFHYSGYAMTMMTI